MSSTFEILIWLTIAVLSFGIVNAWLRYRSPLHPMIILGSLLLYGYGIGPAILYYKDSFEQFFPEPWQLEYVGVINLLGITLFTIGALWRERPEGLLIRAMPTIQVPEQSRGRLIKVANVLGGLGWTAYWQSLQNVGGFTSAYSHAKGGGQASSGYLGEAPLLLYPAILLLGLAAAGYRGKRPFHLAALGIFFALPQIFYGTLGGRRGPLFLVLSTLFLAWFIARRRRPSLPMVLAGFTVILLAVVVVWSQRQSWYLGSEKTEGFDKEEVKENVTGKFVPSNETAGNYYVYASGLILNARYHNGFYWGKRYLVTLFIRPIPHELWPTKYEDTLGEDAPWESEHAWKESLGWIPLAGSASGFIADAYTEFSLGCFVICFMMGRFCSRTWRNSIIKGGIWTILFMQICILGVYLPTQSLSAFWHRYLFMGVPIWFIWKHYVIKNVNTSTTQKQTAPART